MGGDEFAILQTGIRHIDEARLLGLRVIRLLSAPFKLDGHEICIGASIGVALAPRDGLNLEHLISCADEALYESKRAGRGNVILWKERCLNASTTAA
jgi:diguanylate cyclase (GGDEF)-like protein